MRQQPKTSQSAIDLPAIEDDASIEDIANQINKIVDSFNFLNKFISFQKNMDGFIAEDVSIGIGATVKIEHFLGIKPKWRIILRQTGNGVITDIPSEWTDKVISLKNNGAEAVVISIFIARE